MAIETQGLVRDNGPLRAAAHLDRAVRGGQVFGLLERFCLADRRDTLFARLSRGMKRALTVAAALAHRPGCCRQDLPSGGCPC